MSDTEEERRWTIRRGGRWEGWGGGHKRKTEAQKEIRGAQQKKAEVDVTLTVDKEETEGGINRNKMQSGSIKIKKIENLHL